MFAYRMYYRKQKTQVLEELRQGLLFHEGDAEKNTVSKTYLQSLQQDLILKDVFVKYDDIKFEGKIGEGSFGVVVSDCHLSCVLLISYSSLCCCI